MKNLKKADLAIIILTLVCLAFTAGFFIGRGTTSNIIKLEKLDAVTPALQTDPPADDTSSVTETDKQAEPVDTPAADTKPSASGNVPADDISAQPTPDVPTEAPTKAPASASIPPASGKININTASAALLDTLPGIGEVLSGRIITYREENGGFKSIEEIIEVSGIGDKKFSDIRELITIG